MILVVFGTEIKRPAELPHNLIESLFWAYEDTINHRSYTHKQLYTQLE